MAVWKVGDRVRLSTREATPQDTKAGRFYNHFRGLNGVIQKVYNREEIAVEIEPDSLPEDIWLRHMQTRDQMRERWLSGLAEDVRRKLTPQEKDFSLRYVVVVAASDIERRRAERARKAT